MSEIRQNMATKEWVIIATERARRPEEFVQKDKVRFQDRPSFSPTCPFCPGNEEHDLERLRLPSEGDWLTRVVGNRYPALQSTGNRVRVHHGVHRALNGIGHHDVIVETRLHNLAPAFQSPIDIERTLRAFQLRGEELLRDERMEHFVFFKNHGPTAGTSLIHPHAQLLALPVVPYDVRRRIDEARRYYDDHGECVFCRMLAEEEREQVRLLIQSSLFTAFIPYAAFSPFHTWIVPRRHSASFVNITPEELQDLSFVMRRLLRMYQFGLNDPDFNYVVRTAPRGEHTAEHLHWYLSFVPRVSHTAGFELGSGMFINTALPEESARFLRSVDTDQG